MGTQRRCRGTTVCILASLLLALHTRTARSESPKVWDYLAKKYDKNGDGKLSRDEYKRDNKAFARLDRNGDGVLTSDDWRVAGNFPKFKTSYVAPKQGAPAPDFELAYVSNPDKVARLSDFAGKKPVALLFGSCT